MVRDVQATKGLFQPKHTGGTNKATHSYVLATQKLTASTACWRMDVNLENILFFDWTSFSREDLENSSIFFFLLPPRSRLEVSYNDPCNERMKVSNKTVRRRCHTGPHGPGTTTVNKTSSDSSNVCSLWTRWHFPRQTLAIQRSTRGRRSTRHVLLIAVNDQCIQMWTWTNAVADWRWSIYIYIY